MQKDNQTEMNETADLTLFTDDVLEDQSSHNKSNYTQLEPFELNVKVYTSLDDLPEEYNQFFERMSEQSFFFSRPWFENLAQTTLENSAQLRLYGVESNMPNISPQALLIATTPAAQNGAKISGWWVRKSSLAGFTNYQSYTHTLLLPEQTVNTTEVVRKLIAAINQETPKRSLLDLNLFSPSSPTLSLLAWACKDAGMKVSTYFYAYTRTEDLSHLDYKKYLSNRTRSVRKETPRKKRRLEKSHKVRFEVITEQQDANRAISIFNDVYAKSWKEEEYFAEFTPGLIRTCAAAGTLRMGIMYVDEQAVSVDMSIVTADEATFAKSIYDPDFSKHSVGSILCLYMIEYVIEQDKVKKMNFGLYDDSYKRWWCSDREEFWGLVAFNSKTFWGLCGYAAFCCNQWAESTKQYLKSKLRKS